MKRSGWWAAALGLVIVAGAAGSYWWWSHRNKQPLQAAYQTTQVRKGNLEVKISGTGNIKPASRQTLKAASSGKIAAVKMKQGDKVKQGQILATFEQDTSSTIANQIRSKQLDLKKTQLDLENLQQQYKEAQDDTKKADLTISMQKQQLDIESTQADIISLQDNSKALEPITAPIDGTLATFNIKEGDTIGGQGGASATLGEVADYDHLQMVVSIDELDIAKVKLNQTANVLVEALPDQNFNGKVTAIAQEGTASNGVSTFDVTISLDDAASLKAGMSAQASILTDQKADALYLPIEAVESFGGRYFVRVPSTANKGGASTPDSSSSRGGGQTRQRNGLSQTPAGGSSSVQNGRGSGSAAGQSRQNAAFAASGVNRVRVQVGIHNEDYIEIVSGLTEGEAVVIPSAAGSGTNSQTRSGGQGLGGLGLGGAGGFGGGGNFRQSGGGNTRQSGGNGAQGGGSRE